MYLSTHFTSDEFTNSQIAARQHINNDPPPSVLPALHNTAHGMELVRNLLGDKPIIISSGYRSAALNAAAGGSPGSQHLLGEACDFTCPTYGTAKDVFEAIVASSISYDQIAYEYGRWVHISFSNRNRKQALVIDSMGTRGFA